MSAHTAAGRRLGITAEDIDKLIYLKKEDFEHKEWLALKYVQDWVFLNGNEPTTAYISDYQAHYTEKERLCVHKLLKMMRFANYFNNTFFRKPWRSELDGASGSCAVELKKSDP